MEDNLADAVWSGHSNSKQNHDQGDVQVVEWARNDNCVIMLLSNSSLQMNFFQSHEKILFHESFPGGPVCVTVIGQDLTLTLSDSSIPAQQPLNPKSRFTFQGCLAELRTFASKKSQTNLN